MSRTIDLSISSPTPKQCATKTTCGVVDGAVVAREQRDAEEARRRAEDIERDIRPRETTSQHHQRDSDECRRWAAATSR